MRPIITIAALALFVTTAAVLADTAHVCTVDDLGIGNNAVAVHCKGDPAGHWYGVNASLNKSGFQSMANAFEAALASGSTIVIIDAGGATFDPCLEGWPLTPAPAGGSCTQVHGVAP